MYTCVINQVDDKGSLLFVLIAANILNTSFETVIGLRRMHEVLWREIILSRWTFDDFFFKFQFTSRTTRFVCVFFFLWIFRRKGGGSKSTLRLIFMVVTTTYYEVLISDVDQYFIYPLNDKINGQLYTVYFTHIIFSVLPTYAYGIAIFIQTVFWCLQFILYCYSIVHVCISSIIS